MSLLTGLISVQHHFLFCQDSLYIGVTPDPQVSALFSVEPSGLWSIGPTRSATVSLQQAPWQHPTILAVIQRDVGGVMESEVAGDSCARALAALTSSRACGFASLSEFSVLEA